MTLLLILAAASVWSIVATTVAVRRDGYRRVPTDRARLP